MDQQQLQAWLDENAGALGVPGVAIGVITDGVEHYAFHGVTSVDNPLPVDGKTLFCYGSTH
ncbi:MAG: serine hydrolase, partial [Actinomycetota bacterium]